MPPHPARFNVFRTASVRPRRSLRPFCPPPRSSARRPPAPLPRRPSPVRPLPPSSPRPSCARHPAPPPPPLPCGSVPPPPRRLSGRLLAVFPDLIGLLLRLRKAGVRFRFRLFYSLNGVFNHSLTAFSLLSAPPARSAGALVANLCLLYHIVSLIAIDICRNSYNSAASRRLRFLSARHQLHDPADIHRMEISVGVPPLPVLLPDSVRSQFERARLSA